MADIWDKYWKDDKNHDWWQRPAPEIIEFLNSQSATLRPNVLDLGCGIGRHAIPFAIQGFKVSATDVSVQAIEHLRSLVLAFDLTIDTYTCSMLEHHFKYHRFYR